MKVSVVLLESGDDSGAQSQNSSNPSSSLSAPYSSPGRSRGSSGSRRPSGSHTGRAGRGTERLTGDGPCRDERRDTGRDGACHPGGGGLDGGCYCSRGRAIGRGRGRGDGGEGRGEDGADLARLLNKTRQVLGQRKKQALSKAELTREEEILAASELGRAILET
jgi:hypothetical protein